MPKAAATSPVPQTPPAAAVAADLTYEQAREDLVGVVARLEAGGETLEGSLVLWERGEALAARCQQWLDGARARLDAVRSGGAAAEPANDEPANDEPAVDEPAIDEPAIDEPDDEDA